MPCLRQNKSLYLLFCLAALSFHNIGHADFILTHEEKVRIEKFEPWFTGPLIAPSAHVVPQGHYNIEPYLFYTVNTGAYTRHWKPQSIDNFYSTSMQVIAQFGLAKGVDMQVLPQVVVWNRHKGQNNVDIGDMPVEFDFQLMLDSIQGWQPAGKLTLFANVPMGKYKRLNPHKQGTDATGTGSWQPGVELIFSKLFHLGNGIHYFSPRLVISYTIGTVAYVKDLNRYGGALGTRGKVYPGNELFIDAAFEINFTQRWAFAMDTMYSHYNRTRFSGKTTTPVGVPSGEQFSLAPAIEYNWSDNIGAIGGVWFTLGGRNTARFASGVIAINFYI